MKNGNKFITVGGAAGGPMILHWMTKDIRHMFSTMTRALPKYPLPKVVKKIFSTDQVLARVIKLNECLIKNRETHGKPLIENNPGLYVDPNLNVTKVNKVYTIQVISDTHDEKCETGQHI